jgi:Ulp1 family protease
MLWKEVHTKHMSDAHLRTVHDNTSLDVAVVRHLLKILDWQRKELQSSCIIVDPNTLNNLKTLRWGSVWIDTVSRFHRAVAIAHLSTKHFITLQWLFEQKKVYVYDSAQLITADIEEEVFQYARLLASIWENRTALTTYDEWFIYRASTPQQNNSTDCGIFAVMVAYAAVHDVPIMPREHITAMRSKFRTHLLSRGFPGNLNNQDLHNFFTLPPTTRRRFLSSHSISVGRGFPLFPQYHQNEQDRSNNARRPAYEQLMRWSQRHQQLTQRFQRCRQGLFNFARRTTPERARTSIQTKQNLSLEIEDSLENNPSMFSQAFQEQYMRFFEEREKMLEVGYPEYRRGKGLQGFGEVHGSAQSRVRFRSTHPETTTARHDSSLPTHPRKTRKTSTRSE